MADSRQLDLWLNRLFLVLATLWLIGALTGFVIRVATGSPKRMGTIHINTWGDEFVECDLYNIGDGTRVVCPAGPPTEGVALEAD
jgi:ABC-type microcin C transport system permease subunit YejB